MHVHSLNLASSYIVRFMIFYVLCIQFAKRGMNVVLISRSYDDLVQIVSDLRERVTNWMVDGTIVWYQDDHAIVVVQCMFHQCILAELSKLAASTSQLYVINPKCLLYTHTLNWCMINSQHIRQVC